MLKVLLVEDEDLIRRGLRFQMDWTAAGCVVADEAASGREGLEKIGLLRPDVVVTDVRMPDMDGLEMLKRGLEVGPFDAIVVSGYGEFDYAQQAIRLGVAEYLSVDVTVVRLVWLIAALAGCSLGLWAYIICAVVLPDKPY